MTDRPVIDQNLDLYGSHINHMWTAISSNQLYKQTVNTVKRTLEEKNK